MNYFTSIKNNFYFGWQIELLIQSFKLNNLQNNLYIALNNEEIFENCKNLKNHNNIIIGNDYGPLNKFCHLLEAIENNIVDFPITFIHPDMILNKPIGCLEGDIICSVTPDEDDEELKCIKFQYAALPENNNLPDYFPVGSIIVFNNKKSIDFLKGLIGHHLNLIEEKNDFAKIALSRNLYDFYEKFEIKFELLESNLLHNNFESNFIHYKYGVPPSFMKHKFEEELPYDILLNFNSTDNLKYLNQIVKKYLVV